MEALSQRQGQALALGLLASVLALIWAGAVMPYLGVREQYREHLLDLRERLQRYQRIAALRQHYEKQLARLKASPELSARILEQKTPALASAALQRAVQKMIRKSGGRLSSVQAIRQPGGKGAVVPIMLRLALQGDSNVLRSLLYRLEGDRRLLFVDALSVRGRGGTSRRRNGREKLDIRIDLTAYLRRSE